MKCSKRTDGKGVVNSVGSNNMNAVTSNAVAQTFNEIRFRYDDVFTVNTNVCESSNLYNLYIPLGATRLYHLTGWVFIKAGTYTSGTKVFDLPKNSMINNYIFGTSLNTITPTLYQLYVENNAKDVKFGSSVTFSSNTYIQFNQDIVTYAN